jgi:hypothetical protein
MRELLFRYVEPAVSAEYTVLTLSLFFVSSIVLGLITGKLSKSSLRDGLITFCITQIFLLILYFFLRNTVQSERLKTITERMGRVENSSKCPNSYVRIINWLDGLTAIEECPREVGYYLTTCDILEKEQDYESAAILIEIGLNFIQISPPPPPLCQRLQRYYKHLSKAPNLDINCNKFHE